MTIEFREEQSPYDGWEIDVHDYRVVLWRHQTPDPGFTQEEMGWSALIYDLTAEDVHEVIAWAERTAGSRDIYTLYVTFTDPISGERRRVHIAGADPTVHDDPHVKFQRRHPLRAG